MKLYNSRILVMLLIATIGFSCKKSPVDNFSIIINPNVIKYSMLLDVTDAADQKIKPKDIKIGFSGVDAQNIYEATGTKQYSFTDGILNIGLGPDKTPTSSSPAKFTARISAEGYLPITQDFEINPNQQSQIVKLKLINIAKPPAGIEIVHQTVSLVNGALPNLTSYPVSANATPTKLSSGHSIAVSERSGDELTTVVLPKGTTFFYYKTITTNVVVGSAPIFGPQVEEKVPVSDGKASSFYRRIIGYEPVYRQDLVKTTFTANEVDLDAIYVKGNDILSTIYPYNWYTPFAVSLLNGKNVTEDRLLYRTAVLKKLHSIVFKAKVDGVYVTVSPDQQYQWYTSFQLNPATINPLTGNPIAAGDVIECGIDEVARKTLRTTVKEHIAEGGAKQLRAESQTTDIGYYDQATYFADYNYNFNTSLSGDLGISDRENFFAGLNLDITTGGRSIGNSMQIRPNMGDVTLSGKVSSFDPIQIQGGYEVTYWGKGPKVAFPSNTGTASIFANLTSKITIEPTVTFSVALECTSSKKTYRSNGFAYVSGTDGKEGYAYVNNGKWATNGLTKGQTYTVRVYGRNDAYFDRTRRIIEDSYEEVFTDLKGFCGNN